MKKLSSETLYKVQPEKIDGLNPRKAPRMGTYSPPPPYETQKPVPAKVAINIILRGPSECQSSILEEIAQFSNQNLDENLQALFRRRSAETNGARPMPVKCKVC